MRHAVITGGASGIGLAIARHLHAQKHPVTLIGRTIKKLQAAKSQMPNAMIKVCDICDEDQVKAVFSDIPPVSILVNNAGAVESGKFQHFKKADWHAALNTNLLGAVSCIQACLDDIKRSPQGRIINIASTAALKPYPYVAPYVTAKHALLGMTRALALELAKSSVTVNAICPGYTKTAMVEEAVEKIAEKTGIEKNAALEHFEKINPQGQLIDPNHIAKTVLWLISDGAASITGQAITIAGGEIM